MIKKILITHISNSLNYGSAMMAINLIAGLGKRLTPKTTFYLDCDEYHLNRLKVATSNETLMSFTAPKNEKASLGGKIIHYMFGIDNRIKAITSMFDLMIVLGGDDLSEVYVKGAILNGFNYMHINRRTKVLLAGQSLGPFSGIYKILAKIIFRKIIVITREENSYEFCKKTLNIKSVLNSRDLSLIPLPSQNAFSRIVKKHNLINKKNIVFVPSGLVDRYTTNHEGYVATWLEIIKKVNSKFPGYQIVLMPHVLAPERVSDLKIIYLLNEKIKHEESIDVLLFTSPMQPAEARAILGNALFVITGRMHAAVSSFFNGTPAISLAYSEKYLGVIGRGLKQEFLIVDVRNKDWTIHSNIVNEVMDKVGFIINNFENIKNQIISIVEENKKIVEEQLDFIAKQINTESID